MNLDFRIRLDVAVFQYITQLVDPPIQLKLNMTLGIQVRVSCAVEKLKETIKAIISTRSVGLTGRLA